MEFVDRSLKCSDCNSDFVFTAGEQLFFHDKQFKNDPKRCKLCKAKRADQGKAGTVQTAALPLSRTETRTECSACGIETTVPFKPTQGRPVLCRSCFQMKRVPAAVAAVATMDSPAGQIAAAAEALAAATSGEVMNPGVDTAMTSVAALSVSPSAAAIVEMIGQVPMEATTNELLVAAEVAEA